MGHAADAISDDVTATSNLLLANGAASATFHDTSIAHGFSWAAAVDADIAHNYAVTGGLSNFQSISAAGSTDLHTSAGTDVLSQMASQNPGNELYLYFTAAANTAYTFSGNLGWNGYAIDPGNQTQLSLQHFDGIVWGNVYSTTAQPNGTGAFNTGGTLAAGDYRLYSTLQDRAFGTETKNLSFNYTFSTVPEPASLVALAAGAMTLIRRRRRLA